MNDTELKRLEELCEAATPGPWSSTLLEEEQPDGSWERVLNFITVSPDSMSGVEGVRALVLAKVRSLVSDATFIATARSALPEALAEIRRLRFELDGTKQAVALSISGFER